MRAQRLLPRCIADNDDGGLCLEPVVVVVVVVGLVVLDFVDGTGAGGVGAVRGGNLKKMWRGGWGGGRSASPRCALPPDVADNDVVSLS